MLAQGGKVKNNCCGVQKCWEGFSSSSGGECQPEFSYGMDVQSRTYGIQGRQEIYHWANSSARLLDITYFTEDKTAYVYNVLNPGQAVSALFVPETH